MPVLRHFHPSLRVAVHIDGSQNAVGANLLQWHENEDNPRPVAFMSRKLSGVQYRYDVHNVETLAAQMALTTWRTLLLGVKLEIFSDHDFSGSAECGPGFFLPSLGDHSKRARISPHVGETLAQTQIQPTN